MSNTAQFIICVAGIAVTCFLMGVATGIKVTYEYNNQQTTEATMATRKEEKDSLEKVSEDIRNATALVASFHARLVAMGVGKSIDIDDNDTYYYLRCALTSLMAAREWLVNRQKLESKEAK